MSEQVKQLIEAVKTNKSIEVKSLFESIMKQKTTAAINESKQTVVKELSKKMLNLETVNHSELSESVVKDGSIHKGNFTRLVNRISDLTDNNFHSNAAHALAKGFGYDDHAKTLRGYTDKQNKGNGLSDEEFKNRSKLVSTMLSDIKTKYGKDVHAKIYSAL